MHRLPKRLQKPNLEDYAKASLHFSISIAMQQVTRLHGKFSIDLQNFDLAVDGVHVDNSDCSRMVIDHGEDDIVGGDNLNVSFVSVGESLNFRGCDLVCPLQSRSAFG